MKPKFTLTPTKTFDGIFEYRVYEIEPRCQTIRYLHRTTVGFNVNWVEEYYYLSMPYLIFIEHPGIGYSRADHQRGNFYPFFSYKPIKNEQMLSEMIQEKDLFTPPFPNMLETGVCMGNARRYLSGLNELTIKDFWNTAFTPDGIGFISIYTSVSIYPGRLRPTNSVRDLIRNWDWQTRQNKNFGMEHKWFPIIFKRERFYAAPDWKLYEKNYGLNPYWRIPSAPETNDDNETKI